MQVTIAGLQSGGAISPELSFCAPSASGHTQDGGNKSPAISWSKGPAGTKSYAIIMSDADVPTRFDDANQEGKTIPASLPRKTFYHWVLVDMPANEQSLALGEDSSGVNKAGKPPGKRDYGMRGVNDFGGFLKGTFGGYDGPCPPWNDELLHHYTFTVYALDVPTLGLQGGFGGKEASTAMEGHVLASGSITGTYTQNTALIGKQ
ncbi:MAG: YbhB/YbcL family Raf kinase inhibitor-like protein [Alphaproteobacteria bacterium]|nr:YbhB/YbcL family Raf kinase inhibitor-like protein [Alphaproteobacteria bacterium]